jgi:hypothetical protein
LATWTIVIKTAGGINSAQDKAIALHKEIKRLESRRQLLASST